MFIVHVFIHVKPDAIEAFKTATLANVKKSLKEPGIARFDFIEQSDNPCRFVLVEVYRTSDDAGKHKETPHYTEWRDAVAPMMEESRTSTRYTNLAPGEMGWETEIP